MLRDVLGRRPPGDLDPTLDPSAAAALARLLAGDASSPTPTLQTEDGHALRFALFDAVARTLRAAARDRTRPR